MRFQKSSDTKIIENVLAEAKVGDVITYEALSKAIGRDVREFAVGAMQSARRSMLSDKRTIFEAVTNVGFKRLADAEIVDASERDRRRVQRASTKAVRKLGCVNFENLSSDKKRSHLIASAQLGAIVMLSGKSAANRIEKRVTNGTAIPIGETLRMFTSDV